MRDWALPATTARWAQIHQFWRAVLRRRPNFRRGAPFLGQWAIEENRWGCGRVSRMGRLRRYNGMEQSPSLQLVFRKALPRRSREGGTGVPPVCGDGVGNSSMRRLVFRPARSRRPCPFLSDAAAPLGKNPDANRRDACPTSPPLILPDHRYIKIFALRRNLRPFPLCKIHGAASKNPRPRRAHCFPHPPAEPHSKRLRRLLPGRASPRCKLPAPLSTLLKTSTRLSP